MAVGFKVADAYVAVHTEDDTKRGRDKIGRDSDKWSSGLGNLMGGNILRGLMRGLFGFGRFLTTMTVMISKFLLMGVAVGAAASAVAGLLGGIVQLLPVLAQVGQVALAAGGAFLLIPAAIATLLTAVITLKLGFQGLGEALKAGLSGDVEALNEALKKLAPNAAEFVQEVVKLKPAFDRVRLNIQNSLFAGLADLLHRIAEVYLPVINEGLTKMANVINRVFKGVGEFLLGANTATDIGTILANAATAAGNLAAALAPALAILRDVLVVSTGVAAELTSRLAPIFQGWADRIAEMRADGSLAKLITDGIDALKMFGALAGDILGILRAIFKAAGDEEGQGLFGFFDRINKFLNSIEGQTALTQLFDALGEASTALFPVLIVLLQAIIPLLYAISTIAVAFAPGLQVAADALGKALLMLLPGFLALAPLLGIIAEGFAPLAVIINDLVVGIGPYAQLFFTQLVKVLAELAPVAEPVGKALGELLAVIGDLLVVAAPLVSGILQILAEVLIAIIGPLEPIVRDMLPLFVKLIHGLFDAIEPVMPSLVELVVVIAQLATQYLPQMLPLLATWAALALLIAQTMTGELIQTIQDLIPQLPALFQGGFELALALTQLAIVMTPLIVLFIKLLGSTGQLTAAIPVFLGWIQLITTSVELTSVSLQNWISFLVRLGSVIYQVMGIITDWIRSIRDGWNIVTGFISNLGGTILNAVSNFGSLLWQAGRNLIEGLKQGLFSAFPSLTSAMGSIAQTVRNFWPFSPAKTGPLSGQGDMLFAGQNLVGRLVEGVRSEIDSARAAATDLAGLFRLGDSGRLAMAGGAGAAGGAGRGDVYVMVQVGDKPVREMVQGEIVNNPQTVSDATNEGNRQNKFTTGRPRIGDT